MIRKFFTLFLLKRSIQPILRSHGIVRAGLFGSAARGELRADSDIDVLIDTEGRMGLLGIVSLKHDLEKKLDRQVDLVEYRALKPALRASIMADHVAVSV